MADQTFKNQRDLNKSLFKRVFCLILYEFNSESMTKNEPETTIFGSAILKFVIWILNSKSGSKKPLDSNWDSSPNIFQSESKLF